MRLAPTLLAIALVAPGLFPALAWTAEATAPLAPTTEVAALTAEQLAERLPKSSQVVVRDGKVWWDDGKGAAIPFAMIDSGQGNPVVETEAGHLAVDRKLVADGRVEAIALTPRLAAAAKAANLPLEGLTLREGILTGLHLRSDTALVLPEGVLRKTDIPAVDRTGDRQAVGKAIDGLLAALDETKLDDLGRKTVQDVLGRINAEDGRTDVDEVSPSFGRRVVRRGWLNQIMSGSATAKTLVDAVAAAEVFRPSTGFAGTTSTGGELRLAEVKDAYERGGWVLSTPTMVRFTRLHPEPMSHWGTAKMNLVVDLAPGSDPTAVTGKPQAARLFRNGQVVAAWNQTAGFTVDDQAWHEAVPGRGKKGVDPNAVTGFVPPHIAIADLDGDIAGLLTAQGWLAAPSGETKDAERFLREAAEQLRDPSGRIPDAAYVDLVGEHLFAYVYDSPDSRFPLLIGNKGNKGDIHQTSQQTLSTAAGGICRGDCDDAAELFQAIAERQGRTAIVLSLPQHAAAAWAEKRDDGKWHVYVLQTGPALEFSDEKLPKALELAYKSFDQSEAFDPNGLGLLLRFSGENTRSGWRLSYRIFAEPDYARTMIDVQRDWHFQTYQRGINAVHELIAKGDNDTANYRELSGLYSFTGQYDLAAEYHQKAIDRTNAAKEPESRFYMQIELLGHLFDAGKTEAARTLASDLLERELPALKPRLGPSVWQAGLQLAMILSRHESTDLAERAVETALMEKPTDKIDSLAIQMVKLANYAQDPRFEQRRWDNDPKITAIKPLAAQFAGAAISLVKEAGVDRLVASPVLQETAAAAQRWLDVVAFKDIDEPGEAPLKYALAARWYESILGEERFAQLLDAAAPPTSNDKDHTKRIGGVAQMHLDLPWIHICSPYWVSKGQELFAKDKKTLDKAQVARLAKRMEEARAVELKLGIESPMLDHTYHLGRLVAALVSQDAAVVRERLKYVADKNDKRLRDDTAQWIGDTARFLPIDWYGQVLEIWKAESDYKPKWYWIAWRAALNGGTQHALLTAKMAADRFKDDPAFIEEYEFMRKLYEPAVKAPGTAAPKPVAPGTR